jgi:hypothetical protein
MRGWKNFFKWLCSTDHDWIYERVGARYYAYDDLAGLRYRCSKCGKLVWAEDNEFDEISKQRKLLGGKT